MLARSADLLLLSMVSVRQTCRCSLHSSDQASIDTQVRQQLRLKFHEMCYTCCMWLKEDHPDAHCHTFASQQAHIGMLSASGVCRMHC